MKKVLRTFYLDQVSGMYNNTSTFRVGRIEGRILQHPLVGDEISLNTVEAMVTNGNRVVLIPKKDAFRVYQDGSHGREV